MQFTIKQVGPDVGVFLDNETAPRGYIRGVVLRVTDIMDIEGFLVYRTPQQQHVGCQVSRSNPNTGDHEGATPGRTHKARPSWDLLDANIRAQQDHLLTKVREFAATLPPGSRVAVSAGEPDMRAAREGVLQTTWTMRGLAPSETPPPAPWVTFETYDIAHEALADIADVTVTVAPPRERLTPQERSALRDANRLTWQVISPRPGPISLTMQRPRT